MGVSNLAGAERYGHEILSDAACKQLIKQAQQGDKSARDQLVASNQRLVIGFVRRFAGRGAEEEDLFQMGMIGLLKAIDHFDLSFEVCFSTYAVPVIMGEMRRYLRDNSSIRVSRSVKELAYRALQLKETLQKEEEKEPTIEQLAVLLGRKKEDVILALEAVRPAKSLYETVGENKDGTSMELWERIGDTGDATGDWLEKLNLEQCLALLTPKEQWVFRKRHLMGLTQQEIAAELHLSQAQISRLEKKALAKIKEFYTEDNEE
ncbi:MAG: sigma-70 family RNA polymerase sigma factor [Peptococcaceae bacterium]|nr:sigma-70 family RNA polymerase sigma factor [Peptococcaceae bacterium]